MLNALSQKAIGLKGVFFPSRSWYCTVIDAARFTAPVISPGSDMHPSAVQVVSSEDCMILGLIKHKVDL